MKKWQRVLKQGCGAGMNKPTPKAIVCFIQVGNNTDDEQLLMRMKRKKKARTRPMRIKMLPIRMSGSSKACCRSTLNT